MKFWAAAAIIVFAFTLANCAGARHFGLSTSDLAQCRSSGGYESVSPFGIPICQKDYADGGKLCQSTSDCAGRCLSEAPVNAGVGAVGSVVIGRCELQESTFGCYGRVENGKLAEPYVCVD